MTPLQIPSATLSNGVTMPRLVFGTYQIKDPKICQKAVEDALEAGYRAIDTAQSYGNEAAVGAALKACGLPRSELFITTKLWKMRLKPVLAAPLFAPWNCWGLITWIFTSFISPSAMFSVHGERWKRFTEMVCCVPWA